MTPTSPLQALIDELEQYNFDKDKVPCDITAGVVKKVFTLLKEQERLVEALEECAMTEGTTFVRQRHVAKQVITHYKQVQDELFPI